MCEGSRVGGTGGVIHHMMVVVPSGRGCCRCGVSPASVFARLFHRATAVGALRGVYKALTACIDEGMVVLGERSRAPRAV